MTKYLPLNSIQWLGIGVDTVGNEAKISWSLPYPDSQSHRIGFGPFENARDI